MAIQLSARPSVRYKPCCLVVSSTHLLHTSHVACSLVLLNQKIYHLFSRNHQPLPTPSSHGHSLFSGCFSFLWPVCPALLSRLVSSRARPLTLNATGPCSDSGHSSLSEAVSFPMTALPKELAPARAKRKPGMSGEGRPRQVQAACRSGSCSSSNLQAHSGHCGAWSR